MKGSEQILCIQRSRCLFVFAEKVFIQALPLRELLLRRTRIG